MKRQLFLAFYLAMFAITACESEPIRVISPPPQYLPVKLSVQSDTQGALREFPVSQNAVNYRAYVEATRNDRYRLSVMNNSHQRVGLVIAVDGRNIISGQRSDLANHERMYILNPHESGEYEGWRTSSTQTNRFYFTDAGDSYAAAWGDTSAMGVIAMAVYAEKQRPVVMDREDNRSGFGFGFDAKAPASAPTPSTKSKSEAAGTGFGESHYSPTVNVSFEPNSTAMEKVFLKYEWRETLCSKGIMSDCGTNPSNRFWQNDGYAPPPPKH